MVVAWLGIGSNLGDRLNLLQTAVANINGLANTKVLAKSSIYETEPVGGVEQGPFFNGVLQIETFLSPEQLLDAVLAIEKEHGRERVIHWGPRTLDIDILAYGQQVVEKTYLKIPHPYLGERAFVLVPWAEVDGDWQMPGGETINQLLEGLPILDLVGVRKTACGW